MPTGSLQRAVAGAVVGVLAWAALQALLPLLPLPIRFFVPWLLFTLGPGLAVGAWLTRDIDPLGRLIVLLGIGSASTAVLIDGLGRLHLLAVFPYVAFALGGAGAIGVARRSAAETRAVTSRADAAAAAALVALALGLGAVAFSHRLVERDGGILVNGAYDSFDLSFYAAWAAEASHTVPPTASYYAGHQLNGAYYPQLVLAMVHRFAGVPMLDIYFRYSWPTFLALGVLTVFVLVRSLASTGVALLTGVLVLVGGDFSYLAAWFLPHDTVQWDYLLWPTNFLAPTMEVLHFNTWTQALPVFFGALYSIVVGLRTRSLGWMVMSALLVACLFQFKPFAYIVLMAGLTAAALFSIGDPAARRRFAATVVLAVVCTLPFVYSVLGVQDRRSRLLIDFFMLPQRMLIKLDLTDAFLHAAARLAPAAALRTPLFLLLATVVFLLVGPGIRWVGAPGVWRAIRGRDAPDAAAWRLLGWMVVAGVAIPFVLVTDPYVDTLQFYQTGLYLWWIFTACALISFARAHRRLGAVAVALAIAVAVPSSAHFLTMKWTDDRRPPLATLTAADVKIAGYLQTCDPETTVVLHDRATDPSMMAVVSDRRVTLGWGPRYYAVGSEGRLQDINAFYGSAAGDPAKALETLGRYGVTHVVVYARDRVHPDVLKHLVPVLQLPDTTLYALPERGARCSVSAGRTPP